MGSSIIDIMRRSKVTMPKTHELLMAIEQLPKKDRKAAKDALKIAERERSDQSWAEIRRRIRIYFPSNQTVKNSVGGPQNGGTVCFQKQWFQMETFPKYLLYDCVSAREGMLMHNKAR